MSALGFNWEGPGVFRAGSFGRPIYRKEESQRFRPTSPTCGWSKGVPAILEKYNLPYDTINNPFNYTEMLEKSGQSLSPWISPSPLPMRRPTGLATRIIMSNAWRDPEVPARSATIKLTQALWQTSQDSFCLPGRFSKPQAVV
jgi:hypothetical protein